MRIILIIGFFLTSFLLNGQSNIPSWGLERFRKFEDKYTLATYLQPTFLLADLSGEKGADLAILIERKSDKKKGILILFKENDQSFIVGAGHKLGMAGDDFSWIDKWYIYTQEATYETKFKDNGDSWSKEIALNRHGIKINGGKKLSGLIYYNEKEFTWIHQGD